MRPSLFLALGLVTACTPDPKPGDTAVGDSGADTSTGSGTATDSAVVPVDADGDGADSSVDCDDANAARHPGAPEVCDDVDNDCDGELDEEATDARTWYVDADADGHGDAAMPVAACRAEHGLAEWDDDCDDSDALRYPGALEICDDVDNDCDGIVDAPGLITLDGLSNHATIAAALGAAVQGSVVILCDGTYDGNVTLAGDAWLASLHGPAAVTLDAGNVGSVVTVTDGNPTLAGLTITGGTGTLVDGKLVGGGIAVASRTSVTVQDCVVEGNLATRGAGLHMEAGAAAIVTDSVFRDNVATEWGGGAMVRGTFFAFDTRFEDNDASHGGAIAASYVDLSLQAVTATGNAAERFGGAIYAMGSTSVRATDDVVLSGNTSAQYGGAVALNDAESWTGGVLEDNTAVTNGGGMQINVSPGDRTTVSDVVVRRNAATYGAGIHVAAEVDDVNAALTGEVTVTGAVIDANVAESVGGGLYMYQGALALADTTVSANEAPYGAGVYLQGGVQAEADGLAVTANVAGVYAGGLGAEGGSVTLVDAIVTDNTAAGFAAGLHLQGARATVSGVSAFLRNVATGVGGGAWLTGAGAQLTVTGADWGTGADDNGPDDVYVLAATGVAQTGLGQGVSFSCAYDSGGCP